MQELPDSDYFDQAWRQSRQKASLCRYEQDPSAWQEYWDRFAPTYLQICRVLMPSNRELARSWLEKGLFGREARILDIGCGPGTYALPLAELSGEVVALDTSPLMLEMLGREADRLNLKNIRLEQGDWNDRAYNRAFDLVLAANSPAIAGRDALLKMNEASRGYCVLICYAGKLYPTLRHLLWTEIMGEKMQGNTFDISYPFNILYREGFFPHLSFYDQKYCFREKVETVLQNYRAYFKIFGKSGPAVERILEKTIRANSTQDLVEERVSYKLAVMYWHAGKKI